MNEITKETRLESYIAKPDKRKGAILEVLGDREMSARQLATEMGFTERNAVAPRLTEMTNAGILEVCGKAYDALTDRKVALYRRVI